MIQAESNQNFVFGVKNTKTNDGYTINFINIPQIFAKGKTYEETVYYSYRVLANFLLPFSDNLEKIKAYTFRTVDTVDMSENTFYSLITVTGDLDPHKMETAFILPQTTAAHVNQEADMLSKLINYQIIS
ncbi:MAG: hypothetical protein LKF36_05415 [Lactobacillus sp.]|jgi:hypothetical protein|nr:hypothetical protein [Lactobacillus sp.]